MDGVQQRATKLARMWEKRLRAGLFRLEKRKGTFLVSAASYWEHVETNWQTLCGGGQGKNWRQHAHLAVREYPIRYKEKNHPVSGQSKTMV